MVNETKKAPEIKEFPAARLLLVQHGPGGVAISDASAMRAGFTHFRDPVVGQTEKTAFLNLVQHLVGVDQVAVAEKEALIGVMRQLDIGFPEVIDFLRGEYIPAMKRIAFQNRKAARSKATHAGDDPTWGSRGPVGVDELPDENPDDREESAPAGNVDPALKTVE